MANKHVYTDGFLSIGGTDVSGHHNQVAIERQVEILDQTTAQSSGWREKVGGLKNATFSVSGFFDDADVEPSVEIEGGTSYPVVHVPTDSTPGPNVEAWVLAYVKRAQWAQPMSVGELWSFNLSGDALGSKGGLFSARTGISASDNGGTGFLAGAVASGARAYCVLQVHSGSAGTLDVKIVSDAADTFAGATDRATFAQVAAASAPTYEVVEVSGAITDTYWRDDYTVAGGTWAFTTAIVIL